MNGHKGFNARKAAQIAAFFALANGGKIGVLKLVKLIYLADREFMARYSFPMLWDRLVSMPHGPVNSITYSHIDGQAGLVEEWDELLTDRSNHEIGLADAALSTESLDELSEVELEVLDGVWGQFGGMSGYDLRNYTHQHCPEWEDPNGSSTPIPYERVLKFLGKPDPAVIAEEIEAMQILDRRLTSAN